MIQEQPDPPRQLASFGERTELSPPNREYAGGRAYVASSSYRSIVRLRRAGPPPYMSCKNVHTCSGEEAHRTGGGGDASSASAAFEAHIHVDSSVVDDGALIRQRLATATEEARIVDGAWGDGAAPRAVRRPFVLNELAPLLQPRLAHDVPDLLQQQGH